MSSIRVVMPIGEYTAPRANIDEFFPGELTVTAADDDRVMRVFRDGEWLHAAAYDEQGNVAHWFSSDGYKRQMAAIIAAHPDRRVA